MIRINGVDIDKIEISLMQYLEENSISPQRIAVELNEEILPKANYAATVLKDGDVVEIVTRHGAADGVGVQVIHDLQEARELLLHLLPGDGARWPARRCPGS